MRVRSRSSAFCTCIRSTGKSPESPATCTINPSRLLRDARMAGIAAALRHGILCVCRILAFASTRGKKNQGLLWGAEPTFSATAMRRSKLGRQRRVGAEADRGGWEKHHDHRQLACHSRLPTSLELGPRRRPEASPHAQTCLGHPGAPGDRKEPSRPSTFQPRHRQQAARLRPRDSEGRRHICLRSSQGAGVNHSEQDPAASSFRDHRRYA